MFFGFSVTGAFLRPFMQLLQTASKQGDGLFFEPHIDLLKLRAVNSSRSTHFLVTIAAEHLDGYRFTDKGTGATPTGLSSVEPPSAQAQPSCGGGDDVGFYLLLPTKALAATVLRQMQGLCAMHVRYNGAATSTDMVLSCDTFEWECVMACGIVKKFSLMLAEGRPERSFVAPDMFSFDACAAAKVWGALLGWFPASTPRVIVQPLESSLEVWVVDHSERGGDLDGASREVGMSGGGDTRVVASREHFLFLQQQQRPRQSGEGATPMTETSVLMTAEVPANSTRSRGAPLPGKIVEVKPLKQVCMLADQLGMMIRVRSGVEGLPLFVEAITSDAAQQAALAAAPTPPAFTAENVPPMALQGFPNRHSATADSQLRVTFSMYIAAFDVLQQSLDGADAATVSARRSTNSIVTAPGDDPHYLSRASAAANTPYQPIIQSSTSTCGAPPPPPPPPPDEIVSSMKGDTFAATTHDMLTGLTMSATNITTGANPVVDSVCSPPRVLVAPSSTQGIPRGSGEPSVVNASTTTPLQDDGGSCNQHYPFPSPSPSPAEMMMMMVVKATPDPGGGGAVQQQYRCGMGSDNKRPREGCDTESEYPRHPIGNYTTLSASGLGSASALSATRNNVAVADSLSFVPPTNASLGGCIQQPNQSTSGGEQTSFTTHHPLDFNAFMQEIADESREEDFDEEDAELQRFLDSCASMLVVPATPPAPPK